MLREPQRAAAAEVLVDLEQVVGDLQQGEAEPLIAAADHSALLVDRIALVAAGKQPGATGDGVGVGVMRDGSQFAAQLRRRNHVDAGNCQPEDIGRGGQASRDVQFQGLNYRLFGSTIVVQFAEHPLVQRRVGIGRRRLFGPGQHLLQRALVEPHARRDQQLRQPRDSAGQHFGGRGQLAGDGQRQGERPQVVAGEQGREAGQHRLQMLADLALNRRALANEIPPMSDPRPQASRGFVQRRLAQAKAGHGGAVDGRQIVVIGLVAGVGRLPELLGGEGMHHPRLVTGRGERPLHRAMVIPRALDRDHNLPQAAIFRHGATSSTASRRPGWVCSTGVGGMST